MLTAITSVPAQPAPHHSFSEEVVFLQRHLGHLGGEGAFVLGNALQGLQWHIYVAGGAAQQRGGSMRAPDQCIEVCMTDLDPAKVCSPSSGLHVQNAASYLSCLHAKWQGAWMCACAS